MRITLEEARRIAHLAHLRFSDAELDRMRGHLDQILGYVEKLNELSTRDVEPAVGPPSPGEAATSGLRDDAIAATLPTDEALANAPEKGRGHFKVPKVIG